MRFKIRRERENWRGEEGVRGKRESAEYLRDQEKETRVSASSFWVERVGQVRAGRSARWGSSSLATHGKRNDRAAPDGAGESREVMIEVVKGRFGEWIGRRDWQEWQGDTARGMMNCSQPSNRPKSRRENKERRRE
jgi:hypothetical protein